MLKNYIKVAIRNILRNKVFSFINILGLSVGLASVILIILYIKHETSFDDFHEDSNKIFRVISVFKDKNNIHEFPVTLYGVSSHLKDEVPEVKSSTRLFNPGKNWVQYKNENYGKYTSIYSDGQFWDVFSYELLQGDLNKCLKEPNSAIISESMASEIFGDANPLNEVIHVERNKYQVKGIIKDIPANSHLQFDYLLSLNSLSENALIKEGNAHYTYLLLNDPMNHELENKLIESISSYVNDRFRQYELEYGFKLQALNDIHLHSDFSPDFAVTGNIQYIYIFSLIAVFILIIAAFNFVNLSIAKADGRKNEVGIRKIAGAQKYHLRQQFIGESVIIAILAFFLAMFLTETFLEYFSRLTDSQIILDYSRHYPWIIAFVLLSVIIGAASGIYPAYYVARFNSLKIVKGEQVAGKKQSSLQLILVALQFTIAVALIASLFGVATQLSYMKNKDLGFNSDNVLAVYGLSPKLRGEYESIRDDILDHPTVTHVTASATIPGGGTSGMNLKLREQDPNEAFPVREIRVQPGFVDAYEMEILKGRDFSEDRTTDRETFIINESAARMLGEENIIGREVDLWTHRGKVIGVLKDFHFRSMHHKIQPFVLSRYANQVFSISVRFSKDRAEQVKELVCSILSERDPGYTCQYLYVEDYWENKYSREDKSAKLIIAGTILALIISIMGLFALTAFNVNQRIKEIGIRKALGANLKILIKMFLKQYLKWVFLASFIAVPLAYWFMKNWLTNFAYHTSIQWWFFLAAICIALLISTLTVLMKVVKAANTNPVDTLRYE
jgi:putative ABC transport system permease protein